VFDDDVQGEGGVLLSAVDLSGLPAPLVAEDVDLRDFPHTPMYRSRLFGSAFHSKVSDGGWRAGVTLWMKSWDQCPAGTLPDDDVELCRLAEFGRDVKSWRKASKEGLWGWFKCSDGRLHHKVVAEGVNHAWKQKMAQRNRTDSAREALAAKRLLQSGSLPSQSAPVAAVTVNPTKSVENSVTVTVTDDVTDDVTEAVTKSKGREEKERKERTNPPPSSELRDERVVISDCRKDIVDAFRRANSPNLPDTSRVSTWIEQGYRPKLIIAVVAEILAKNNAISTLSYFDKAVARAHEVKAPPPQPAVEKRFFLSADHPEVSESNLRAAVSRFVETGRWPMKSPGPGDPACTIPAEFLPDAAKAKSIRGEAA
jgi:hypothetical protein